MEIGERGLTMAATSRKTEDESPALSNGASKSSDGRSRRQSKDQTRMMLLETGRKILIDEGYSEKIDVKLTNVLRAHQLTTGAGYNIWENQDAFQQDLALYIASEYSWAKIDADAEGTIERTLAAQPDASFDDVIRAVCVSYFELFVEKDEFFVALRHWGVKKPSPQLRRAIRKGYEQVHADLSELISGALLVQGRQMRDGVDFRMFISSITASVEGLAFRHRFATKAERKKFPDAYADTYLALQAHYTEPIPADGT